jgi:copper chaperone NosL
MTAMMASLLLAACAVEPQPVLLGAEECGHCRMVISDLQFTAQALTTKGKSFRFDAIECLAEWVTGDEVPEETLHSTWVADFDDPESWLSTEEAYFLRSDQIRSPMGAGLTAYASADAAEARRAEFGGEVLRWREVRELLARGDGSLQHQHATRP